jgi:hypothetical protein
MSLMNIKSNFILDGILFILLGLALLSCNRDESEQAQIDILARYSVEIISIDSSKIITYWQKFVKRAKTQEDIAQLAEMIAYDKIEGEFGYILEYKRPQTSKEEFIKSYRKLFTKKVITALQENGFNSFNFSINHQLKQVDRFSVWIVSCEAKDGLGGQSLYFQFCRIQNQYLLCTISAAGGEGPCD